MTDGANTHSEPVAAPLKPSTPPPVSDPSDHHDPIPAPSNEDSNSRSTPPPPAPSSITSADPPPAASGDVAPPSPAAKPRRVRARARPRRRGAAAESDESDDAADANDSDASLTDASSVSDEDSDEDFEDAEEGEGLPADPSPFATSTGDAKPTTASPFADAQSTTPAAWSDMKDDGAVEEVHFGQEEASTSAAAVDPAASAPAEASSSKQAPGGGKGKPKVKREYTEEETRRYEAKKEKRKEKMKERKRLEKEGKTTAGAATTKDTSAAVGPAATESQAADTKSGGKLKRRPTKDRNGNNATSSVELPDQLSSLNLQDPTPESSSPASPAIPTPSSSTAPNTASRGLGRSNPREAYANKIAADPKYTPRVGGFWTHDQRHYGSGEVGEGYAGLRDMSGYWRGRGRGFAMEGGAGRGDFRGRGFLRGRGRGGFGLGPRGGPMGGAWGGGRYATEGQDEIAPAEGPRKDGRLRMDIEEEEERARAEMRRRRREEEEEREKQRVAQEQEAGAAAGGAEAGGDGSNLIGPDELVEAVAVEPRQASPVRPVARAPRGEPKWGHEAFEAISQEDQAREAFRGGFRGRGRGRGSFAPNRGGFIPHVQARPPQPPLAPVAAPAQPPPPAQPPQHAAAAAENQSTQPTTDNLLSDEVAVNVTVHLPGSKESINVPFVTSATRQPPLRTDAAPSQNATATTVPQNPSTAAEQPPQTMPQPALVSVPIPPGPSPLPTHLTGGSHGSHPSHPSSTPRPFDSENSSPYFPQQAYLPPGIGMTPSGEYFNLANGQPVDFIPPSIGAEVPQSQGRPFHPAQRFPSGSAVPYAQYSPAGSFEAAIPQQPVPMFYPPNGMAMPGMRQGIMNGYPADPYRAESPYPVGNPYGDGAQGAPGQMEYFAPPSASRKVSIRKPTPGEGSATPASGEQGGSQSTSMREINQDSARQSAQPRSTSGLAGGVSAKSRLSVNGAQFVPSVPTAVRPGQGQGDANGQYYPASQAYNPYMPLTNGMNGMSGMNGMNGMNNGLEGGQGMEGMSEMELYAAQQNGYAWQGYGHPQEVYAYQEGYRY